MDSLLRKNKDRLFIALYDLAGPFGGLSYDTGGIPPESKEYQWALLIAPKEEFGDTEAERWLMRRTSIDGSSSQIIWKVENDKVLLRPHDHIIARILIGKVMDRNRLAGILLISKISSTASEEPRTHLTWIREMVTDLRKDGKCCKHLPEWEYIEQACVEFAGKSNYSLGQFPTLDIISRSSGKTGSKQPVKDSPSRPQI